MRHSHSHTFFATHTHTHTCKAKAVSFAFAAAKEIYSANCSNIYFGFATHTSTSSPAPLKPPLPPFHHFSFRCWTEQQMGRVVGPGGKHCSNAASCYIILAASKNICYCTERALTPSPKKPPTRRPPKPPPPHNPPFILLFQPHNGKVKRVLLSAAFLKHQLASCHGITCHSINPFIHFQKKRLILPN